MDNIINKTLPLSDEQLDKYFDNIKDYIFNIDIKNSTIKGKVLLNYIYNSEMVCELQIDELNDELIDIVYEYLITNKLFHIPVLSDLGCMIIHYYINNNIIEDLQLKIFINKFIDKYPDLVKEIVHVFFYIKMIFINEINSIDNNFIEEKQFIFVGNNIISLRFSSYFWNFMNDSNFTNLPFYNYNNFNDFSFEGLNGLACFRNEMNPFSLICSLKRGVQKENEYGSTNK